MADTADRAAVMAWAVPAYFRIVNRLSTPGSPGWIWAVGNTRIEAGLVARGVLPGGTGWAEEFGDADAVIPRRPQWRQEEVGTP
jgi:hypothetical protein